MVDFEKKYAEAHAKAERINNLGVIYKKVKDSMEWDTMEYQPPDEEHEEKWFTEPSETSYNYDLFCAYKEVLNAIEKLADK